MKITKTQLKQIIKEEVSNAQGENIDLSELFGIGKDMFKSKATKEKEAQLADAHAAVAEKAKKAEEEKKKKEAFKKQKEEDFQQVKNANSRLDQIISTNAAAMDSKDTSLSYDVWSKQVDNARKELKKLKASFEQKHGRDALNALNLPIMNEGTMKITKTQLKQIIKEEVSKSLKEDYETDSPEFEGGWKELGQEDEAKTPVLVDVWHSYHEEHGTGGVYKVKVHFNDKSVETFGSLEDAEEKYNLEGVEREDSEFDVS